MAGGSMFSDEGGIGGLMMGMGDMTGINLSGIPFVGGLFPDPNQKAMRDALQNASNMMGAQRAQTAGAYQNLANNALGALQPAQNALYQMYGGGSQPLGTYDFGQSAPPLPPHLISQTRGMDTILAGAGNDLAANFPGNSGGGGLLGGLLGGGNGTGGLGGMLGGMLGGPSGGQGGMPFFGGGQVGALRPMNQQPSGGGGLLGGLLGGGGGGLLGGLF